ncbi:hypothetical protein MNAN1_001375 [Malassezia nana]|uniref:AAA+ ATPase domain-containing protein n=1 Tax=Malassezia nana TaxID=180528 RepID=A0AAF0J6V8_9BASI|nr:hypothetical protein MNAN1_001375 [Malassezia nana]
MPRIEWKRQCFSWLARVRQRLPSMSYIHLYRDLSRAEVAVLGIGTVAAIAAGVPLPIIGVLFGQMVNGFNEQVCLAQGGAPPDPAQQEAFLASVRHHVLQMVVVASINLALIWTYTSCWSFLGERIVRRLRQRYVRALLSQDMSYFDLLPPGEISTRLGENLIAVQNGTSEKVGLLLSSVAYFAASYIVAFILLPSLAAQLVSLVPAFLLVSLVGAHFVSRATTRMTKHLSDATSIATEALQNLPVVHSFQVQKPLGQLLHAHLRLVRRCGMGRALFAGTMLGCLFFVAYSANALAFHSGSRMVSSNMRSGDDASSTVGQVYTVIFLLLDASFVVGQISPYLQTFSAAGGAGEQLLRTIRQPTPVDALSEEGLVPPPSDAPLGFCFRDVRFAYPARPEALVLRQLTLDVEPGQRVGICGLSGSGKSTIVALLHRFYEPVQGHITLHDGTPINSLQVRWLRSQIGLVGQEPVLFDCTILENIAHGLLGSPAMVHLESAIRWLAQFSLDHPRLPADWQDQCPPFLREELEEVMARCEEAAHLSYADDFIRRLPQGYGTRIGEGGRSLSGGQKQRIALARAVVKQPRVLVLDEATAALDSHSEMAVQAALDRVSQNRTTIAIAHRLSTIRDYDKIVVMADGAVVEQGTHAELLKHQGPYATLVQAQNEHETSDVEDDAQSEPSTKEAPCSRPEIEAEADVDELPGRLPMPMPAQPVVPPPGGNPAGAEGPVRLPAVSQTRALGRLVSMALPQWPYALLGVCASAVIGGAFSGEAVLFGHVIEAMNPCKSAEQVESSSDRFALYFFVLALIELAAYFVSGASFGFVSEWLLVQIRQRLFSVLVTRPLAWYEAEQVSPNSLMTRLSTDTSHLGGLTATVIGTIVSILVNLVAGITLAHIVAWRIAVVILATVPILVVAGYLRLKVIADFQKRHETAYAQSTALAVEAVSSMRTVAALGRERDVLQLFQYSLERPYRESLRHLVVGNLLLAISLSISYFIYGFAYWWGSKNVAEQRYTQVAFFTVLPALLFSAQSSGQLLAFAPDFTKAQVSAANIFSLLDRTEPKATLLPCESPDLEAEKKPNPMHSGPLPVSFEGVRFTYTGRDTPALDGIDLSIPAGAFAAFIGPSGSGKSTAMHLIQGLYAPSQGTVRIGGYDSTSMSANTSRSAIAIVPQEAMLFRGSVEWNVALGLPDPLSVPAVQAYLDATHHGEDPRQVPVDPRIVAACQAAHVHDTIETLPDRYQTDVGAGGSQLSGGQKQRVAIARALVRTPRLLLLDESTSAMDAASEQAFQETLRQVRVCGYLRQLHQRRTCTMIAVAHRMRTIRAADIIFLLDHGRIVARGTHNELIQSCPQYQAMISHQTL